MRLKSFHGPNLTEAMRRVREALGEDAIIVATRDDEAGGIRVTAAIEDQINAASSELAQEPSEPDGSEVIETIAESLTYHQVPAYIAERLLATATQYASDDPVLALGAALDVHFKFQPIVEDKHEKPLMLVGPPGAGKTLCVAKFATRATLGKRPVTVVSMDTERAGGMEQLAAFTRLLNLKLVETEDPHALRDALSLQQGALVFVDTPGRNPFDETDRQQVLSLTKIMGHGATLVLPAGMDGLEAGELAQSFKALGATRLLITRLDITKRIGSLLRVAFDAQLPFANLAASSKVIDPPQPVNPVALARLLLPKNIGSQQKNDPQKQTAL